MIQASIEDLSLLGILDKLPPEGITVFTLEGGQLRGALVNASLMVNRMRANHGLGPVETLLLGRAYIAAALLSVTIKGEDRIVLRVEGSGHAQGYCVETSARGEVRGRLYSAPILFKTGEETLDPAKLIGKGYLTFTRFQEGKTEPVSGRVELENGNIAQDLAKYFLLSEQTRTAFTTSLEFDQQGRVIGAGGLYLQALPGATDIVLDRIERLLAGLPQLGKFFASGASREDFVFRALNFFDVDILGTKNAGFSCPCTRERLGSFVAALPENELRDLAANGPFPAKVTCRNCGSEYHYDKTELENMIKGNKGNKGNRGGAETQRK